MVSVRVTGTHSLERRSMCVRERESVNIKSCNITLLPQYRTIKINYCVCSRDKRRAGQLLFYHSDQPRASGILNFSQDFYRAKLLYLSSRLSLLSVISFSMLNMTNNGLCECWLERSCQVIVVASHSLVSTNQIISHTHTFRYKCIQKDKFLCIYFWTDENTLALTYSPL